MSRAPTRDPITAPTLPPLVRETLRRTWWQYGRLTSVLRMLPSFLIVGAQRCGTTSLYRALTQHPDVIPAVRRKGVHYFDMDYTRPMAWYRGHFPTRITAARASLRRDGTVITGESSPYYMFHPLAGERIARDLPGVKLIVLLRDPVERAYSAHAHEFARGYETEPFVKALELEPWRLDGEVEKIVADLSYVSHHHQHHAYLTRGHYVDQLEALAGRFGRHALHVVDSHELFDDPAPVYDGVTDFLGIPRWPGVDFGRRNARPRAPMPRSVRARLEEHFQPYDERLAAWLGKPPYWRR